MLDDRRVVPAPATMPRRAGQFYIAKGPKNDAEYLQPDGRWGYFAHYFPNKDVAEQARSNSFCPRR